MAGWIEFEDCPKCGKEAYTEDDMFVHSMHCKHCGYEHTITHSRYDIENKVDGRMEDIIKSRLELCQQQMADLEKDKHLTIKQKNIIKSELSRDINHYSYQLLYLTNPNVEDECY